MIVKEVLRSVKEVLEVVAVAPVMVIVVITPLRRVVHPVQCPAVVMVVHHVLVRLGHVVVRVCVKPRRNHRLCVVVHLHRRVIWIA